MSELKAIRSEEIYNIIEYEDCYRTDDLYYLKSEADEVIDELKVKLKVQTSIAEEAWRLKDLYHTDYARAVRKLYEKDKELRHQKYKRCLTMADNCEKEAMVVCYNEPRIEWLGKWKLRWLTLAEKFKEA